MTKEELEKEAEVFATYYESLFPDEFETFYKAFLKVAEPREKRIAELKATCNKWFEHLKNREEELLNKLNNQNAKYNKQIEDLEKENAELKDDNKVMADNYSKMEQKFYDNLTKAKVFIRSLKSLIEDVCDINYLSKDNTRLLVEAEQFLNEVEK